MAVDELATLSFTALKEEAGKHNIRKNLSATNLRSALKLVRNGDRVPAGWLVAGTSLPLPSSSRVPSLSASLSASTHGLKSSVHGKSALSASTSSATGAGAAAGHGPTRTVGLVKRNAQPQAPRAVSRGPSETGKSDAGSEANKGKRPMAGTVAPSRIIKPPTMASTANRLASSIGPSGTRPVAAGSSATAKTAAATSRPVPSTSASSTHRPHPPPARPPSRPTQSRPQPQAPQDRPSDLFGQLGGQVGTSLTLSAQTQARIEMVLSAVIADEALLGEVEETIRQHKRKKETDGGNARLRTVDPQTVDDDMVLLPPAAIHEASNGTGTEPPESIEDDEEDLPPSDENAPCMQVEPPPTVGPSSSSSTAPSRPALVPLLSIIPESEEPSLFALSTPLLTPVPSSEAFFEAQPGQPATPGREEAGLAAVLEHRQRRGTSPSEDILASPTRSLARSSPRKIVNLRSPRKASPQRSSPNKAPLPPMDLEEAGSTLLGRRRRESSEPLGDGLGAEGETRRSPKRPRQMTPPSMVSPQPAALSTVRKSPRRGVHSVPPQHAFQLSDRPTSTLYPSLVVPLSQPFPSSTLGAGLGTNIFKTLDRPHKTPEKADRNERTVKPSPSPLAKPSYFGSEGQYGTLESRFADELVQWAGPRGPPTFQ